MAGGFCFLKKSIDFAVVLWYNTGKQFNEKTKSLYIIDRRKKKGAIKNENLRIWRGVSYD
jgi:uncharacterized protein YjlB